MTFIIKDGKVYEQFTQEVEVDVALYQRKIRNF